MAKRRTKRTPSEWAEDAALALIAYLVERKRALEEERIRTETTLTALKHYVDAIRAARPTELAATVNGPLPPGGEV